MRPRSSRGNIPWLPMSIRHGIRLWRRPPPQQHGGGGAPPLYSFPKLKSPGGIAEARTTEEVPKTLRRQPAAAFLPPSSIHGRRSYTRRKRREIFSSFHLSREMWWWWWRWEEQGSRGRTGFGKGCKTGLRGPVSGLGIKK